MCYLWQEHIHNVIHIHNIHNIPLKGSESPLVRTVLFFSSLKAKSIYNQNAIFHPSGNVDEHRMTPKGCDMFGRNVLDSHEHIPINHNKAESNKAKAFNIGRYMTANRNVKGEMKFRDLRVSGESNRRSSLPDGIRRSQLSVGHDYYLQGRTADFMLERNTTEQAGKGISLHSPERYKIMDTGEVLLHQGQFRSVSYMLFKFTL